MNIPPQALRCSFSGCQAFYDPQIAGNRDSEGGTDTGWRWPEEMSLRERLEDEAVPVHEHAIYVHDPLTLMAFLLDGPHTLAVTVNANGTLTVTADQGELL